MARFFADENFPMPAVQALRDLRRDGLVESELAERALPDAVVLEHATRDNRLLLTMNRKRFIRLHRARSTHAGIVVCTFDADLEALAGRIHARVSEISKAKGKLIRIQRSAS